MNIKDVKKNDVIKIKGIRKPVKILRVFPCKCKWIGRGVNLVQNKFTKQIYAISNEKMKVVSPIVVKVKQ